MFKTIICISTLACVEFNHKFKEKIHLFYLFWLYQLIPVLWQPQLTQFQMVRKWNAEKTNVLIYLHINYLNVRRLFVHIKKNSMLITIRRRINHVCWYLCGTLGCNSWTLTTTITARNIPLTRVNDNNSPTKIAFLNVVAVVIVVYIFLPRWWFVCR